MKHLIPLVLSAALLSGCVAVSVNRNDSTGGRSSRNASLIETDRACARVSSEQGMAAAWEQYSDSTSIRLTPSGPIVRGMEALRAEAASLPAGALTWEPQNAEVSSSGDLGWTWGDYRLAEGGKVTTGRYVTVWRKRHGAWRIAADIGTEVCP